MQKPNSLEKTLMLGKIEGRRRRGWQTMRWLHGITDSMDMGLSKLQEMLKDREAWRVTVHGVSKSQTWLSEWATTAHKRCQLSLEPARCSNSISHSNKLYSPLILPHVWKLFSSPCTDHDTTHFELIFLHEVGVHPPTLTTTFNRSSSFSC